MYGSTAAEVAVHNTLDRTETNIELMENWRSVEYV